MTREDLIYELKQLQRALVECIEADKITDYAREKAYIDIGDAIVHLKENHE